MAQSGFYVTSLCFHQPVDAAYACVHGSWTRTFVPCLEDSIRLLTVPTLCCSRFRLAWESLHPREAKASFEDNQDRDPDRYVLGMAIQSASSHTLGSYSMCCRLGLLMCTCPRPSACCLGCRTLMRFRTSWRLSAPCSTLRPGTFSSCTHMATLR